MQFPQPTPYLSFRNNTAEAFKFYQQVFGGQVNLIKFGDAPQEGMPEENTPEGCAAPVAADADLAMHANLMGGDVTLMASDTPSSMAFKPIQGISLSVSYPDTAKARHVFEQLAQGGQVVMPLGETFWVELFGMCTDRFGVGWMVNGGTPKMAPGA